ncbi:phosphotransferase system PTS lactose/cellobiose-specific IIA subunit [Coriobacterium glomerans PW2]|uniref:Phosphotransferase system PTS lactose/cellobiose-specific IIA subunit n=1 Tax=Coriobacterium glomerans (strain ATCC 49209 / DSM 20642 / JCM 10262 / PW2) TaxID=700015 RepID=F2N8X6_CORGP|nr:PTS lactose/cellobiose transporter subunit IIA [Coriobacterium glomerans]AEB07576.1 phosphotransferase system PTS lactose/cellobiose-specific IIA subunit [Coriobacterium glomerans PW2]
MEDVNELELTCFEIISYVGSAKSSFVEAIAAAKAGDLDRAEALVKQGDENYNSGHEVHMKLLQADAAGARHGEAPLILLHAEDQMAGTEIVKILTVNFIDVYRELMALRAKSGLSGNESAR